jgi:hypothetical protein
MHLDEITRAFQCRRRHPAATAPLSAPVHWRVPAHTSMQHGYELLNLHLAQSNISGRSAHPSCDFPGPEGHFLLSYGCIACILCATLQQVPKDVHQLSAGSVCMHGLCSRCALYEPKLNVRKTTRACKSSRSRPPIFESAGRHSAGVHLSTYTLWLPCVYHQCKLKVKMRGLITTSYALSASMLGGHRTESHTFCSCMPPFSDSLASSERKAVRILSTAQQRLC